MKIKDLIKLLQDCNQEGIIYFSSDEELNCLRSEGQIGENEDQKEYYIYGLDGTEVELWKNCQMY